MTDALTKAAQAALDALDNAIDHLPKPYSTGCSNAATDLRAALAAQQAPDLIPQDALFSCPQMGNSVTRVTQQAAQPVAWLQPATVDSHIIPGRFETCGPGDYAAFPVYRDAQPQQAAADHPAYQLGFADGAAQYAHKTRGQIREQAAQPVAQEPRVCWLVEEFSDSGNSTGRYMLDQNGLTITTDAQQARRFLGSRTATFRATDMREKWGTSWRPVSHVFRAAQPQQAEGDTP